MVRAAEPESEYEKEGGQDKEESKRPVSWEFKDGVLTVSGEGEMPDYSGTEEVPWIAVRDSVRKIVIEEGITSIGKQSFSNFENLEEVVFPETLKIIGNGAFFECSSLAQVILPESVERLGTGAFAGCRSLASFSGKDNEVSALTFLGTPVGEIHGTVHHVWNILADPFAEAADLAESMVGTSEKYKYKAKIRLMGGLCVGDAKQAAVLYCKSGIFSIFRSCLYKHYLEFRRFFRGFSRYIR